MRVNNLRVELLLFSEFFSLITVIFQVNKQFIIKTLL